MPYMLRGPLLALLFFFLAVPVHAANLIFLDSGFSIVPEGCTNACPCGSGAVLQFIQNIMNAGISLGVVALILVIAYVGILFLLSPTNPEAKSKARSILANAAIGFLLVVAGWLIVDFIMKFIYNPEATFNGQNIGPWNEILQFGGDICINKHNIEPIAGLPGVFNTLTNGVILSGTAAPGGGGGSVGVAGGLCDERNTKCSPAVMKAEGLTDAQANAMSCIAVTESSGGSNQGNSGTGAAGLFQITGENWRNPAIHRPPCSVRSSRFDFTCNRQAAVLMFRASGYQPWTGKCMSRGGCGFVSYGQYWNPNAVACVQKYDPSGRI